MPQQLYIPPLDGPFDTTLRPPGSKSLTNRALLLAALAEGTSHLTGVLFSDDTRVMLEALRRLGFELQVDEDARTVVVTGRGGDIPAPSAHLFLGNAGTAFRFLTAACCLESSCSQQDKTPHFLDGTPRMRQRPIHELAQPLATIGGRVRFEGTVGYPPLRVWGTGLRGGEIVLRPTVSSQFISALLQVAPCSRQGVSLIFDGPVTSQPYVEMTLAVMRRFGAKVKMDDAFTRIDVAPTGYRAVDEAVEPDASSAGYFWAAAAINPGSACTIGGLSEGSLQGDVGLADMLGRMGAQVTREADAITVAAPSVSSKPPIEGEFASDSGAKAPHDDGSSKPSLRGIDVDLNHMPDAAMTLATVAACATGPTTIRNVGNWRVKETDRMTAMQTEVAKLGATVQCVGDDITIIPPAGGRLRHAAIDTYDDHRMAMSFAILGLRAGGPGITINDPRCVEKTFPDFFDYLDRLRTTQTA